MKWKYVGQISLIVLSLLNLSCGRTRDVNEFEPYIKSMEEDGSRILGFPLKVSYIKFSFASLDDSQLARCVVGINTPRIEVNQNTWKGLSEQTRIVTIRHEVGHCSFDFVHDNTQDYEGRKWKSIMAQWPQRVEDYLDRKSDYDNEFFKSIKKK